MNINKDNILAKLIQDGFPLVAKPYQQIAKQIDASPEWVMQRIASWKDEKLLREISAVMEGSVIGYDSALVCTKVSPDKLTQAANIISEHPTVTHNYERNHDYNLWFTIAVPFSMGLENHLKALQNLTGLEEMHALRRTLTFKVGVSFDFEKMVNQTQKEKLPTSQPNIDFDQTNIKILRTLQKDLPVSERPFADLATQNDLKEDDLLDFASQQKGKAMRRYIGTFRHRKMGISSNGMVVWNIPETDLPKIGNTLANASEVSHCYARNNFPGFNYNLYSMIHAANRESLLDTTEKLANDLGYTDYKILESPTEFKKTRLRYFLPELDSWWERNRASIAV